MMRRGDNIPTVAEYAHWNEEAEAMWYAENRYDMEHADEELDIEDDWRDYEEPDPDIEMQFATKAEAEEFMERPQDWGYDPESLTMTEVLGVWYVDGYTKELHQKYVEINRRARFN
jgi:hypothetical protein